jgi:hypothetical protein
MQFSIMRFAVEALSPPPSQSSGDSALSALASAQCVAISSCRSLMLFL